MFKSKSQPDLPTWYAWKKENKDSLGTIFCDVSRILVRDDYKTVTFFTEEFRYSLKFDTLDLYCEATDFLTSLCDKCLVLYFHYDHEKEEADVEIRLMKDADVVASLPPMELDFLRTLKFYKWGYSVEKAIPPQPKKPNGSKAKFKTSSAEQ